MTKVLVQVRCGESRGAFDVTKVQQDAECDEARPVRKSHVLCEGGDPIVPTANNELDDNGLSVRGRHLEDGLLPVIMITSLGVGGLWPLQRRPATNEAIPCAGWEARNWRQ